MVVFWNEPYNNVLMGLAKHTGEESQKIDEGHYYSIIESKPVNFNL